VTAKREGGSSARASLDTGPLSTQLPPDGVGPYEAEITLNVYADTDLGHQASWRLHVGTWDEARYPSVHIDLAALAQAGKQTLVTTAAGLDVGDHLALDDLPAWLPPDRADLLALGFAETLLPFGWDISVTCAPYGPWRVGVLSEDVGDDNPLLGYLDWDSCVLAEDLTTTETAVDVTTTPLISTDADDFPFDIYVGGERMTVTACSGTSNPQTLTVSRSVNGVVKSHETDAVVTLVHPLILTM